MRGSPFGYSNFSRGLNTIDSPYTLQEGETRDCLNVVATPRGSIRKRNGSTLFASGGVGQMVTLATTDNFNRANEDPLSNGAKWKKLPGAERSMKLVGNQVTGVETEGGPFCASYYETIKQKDPCIQFAFEAPAGHFFYLFMVNAVAGEAWKGYFITFKKETGTEWEWKLSKKTGTESLAASTTLMTVNKVTLGGSMMVGLAVKTGIVSMWRLQATAWELIGQVSDATYTEGYGGLGTWTNFEVPFLDIFAIGEAAAAATAEEIETLVRVQIGTEPYLIVATKKLLLSINKLGEISQIGSGFTNGRWSIVQAQKTGTTASGYRVENEGPVFMSNGVDPPQYWTGVAKGTAVVEWTAKAEGAFVAPPKAKYLVYFGNRIWAAGISGDESALRFSGFAVLKDEGEGPDPSNWPKENVVWLDRDDGSPITGIGVVGSYLLVFKKHKTWVVYDLNEGENRRISDSVGCVSHRSIVETPNGTFFLTPDQGVFSTNGSTVREVSYNVRPTLQKAKGDKLEFAAAGCLNNHYYLSFAAEGSSKLNRTLDFDLRQQSWWLHDLVSNQWTAWEPTTGPPALYACPPQADKGIVKAFADDVYQDSGYNYTGAKGLTAYWISPWEPFFQYVMRHRINAPMQKKRVRQLFFDGSGQIIPFVFKNFSSISANVSGVVENADEAHLASTLQLTDTTSEWARGTGAWAEPPGIWAAEQETAAARLYSLGVARVWSIGFGNNSSEPFEVDGYSMLVNFRKS